MCRKWFWDFLAPPKLGGVQKNLSKMKKFKVAQNCLKWRENWSKKYFWTFQQMFTDVYKFASKCAQICACLKSYAWIKYFGFLAPPPKNGGGPTKNLGSKVKKIKVAPNCLKWREI